jgi:multidrug efflux system membrane fusion protein
MKLYRLLPLPFATLLLTGCPKGNDTAGPGKSGAPPVPVNVATAVKKDIPFDVRTFGNVEPIASVAIKAQVAGELIGVHFEEGDEVEAKKLLFTIQPRLYDTQKAQAQANLDRDRAVAANALLALKRQEALDAKGSGVKEELEKARALVASTEATVRADEALLLIAETQVGYTTVEAPMAGRTGAIRLREGNLIRTTDDEPLTTIVQMAPIYVTFALPEQHLDAIRKGLSASENKLTVSAKDSRDGRLLGEGKVTFIANSVDATTGTITVKATFDNKDRALWPGAFVDVSVRLGVDTGVVVVPSSAVMVGQNGEQVMVVKEDSTAESRQVKVLRTAGQESIIEKGVAVGETVISGGQSRVLPGGKVVPKNPESPGTPAPANPKPPEETPASQTPAGKPSTGASGLRIDAPGTDSRFKEEAMV